MTTPTRIPADVERSDRLVAGLTARQLGLLTATAVLLYLAWTTTRAVVSPPVFVAVAIPVGTATAVLALTSRHGLSGDQLLLAAVRHRLRPRHFLAAPEGLHPAPRWLTAHTRKQRTSVVPQPLTDRAVRLPAAVTPAGAGQVGVVDLGADGLAVIAAAGTVNLALHTSAEQDSLVAQLGSWLHSLTQPVQILLRSTRLDVTGHITRLRGDAATMSPDLAAAARDHADHLAQLAEQEQLLRRQVLLVWREPLDLATVPVTGLSGPSAVAMTGWLLGGRRRAQRELSAAARRAAQARLLRRLSEAADMLAPLGITVTALDHTQAATVLAAATHPDRLIPDTADTGAPGAIITASAEADEAEDIADLDDTAGQDTAAAGAGRRRRGWARRTLSGGVSAFAPDSLTVGARALEVGGDHLATIAITGFPREVGPAWLAPLLAHPGRLDVAVHIEPVDPVTAATRLHRQQARLEATRRSDAHRDRMPDEQVRVAAEDAAELAERIARGQGRLFRAGIYLTVHADTTDELAEQLAAVRALAASVLIDTTPLTYRAVQGWAATLPLGVDQVRLRRTFDTDALAAMFPFTSPQLPVDDPVAASRPTGVFYGRDAAGGLLFWDRFAEHMHNHNALVLGRSGSGKSYLLKAEILRSLHRGIEQIVIDPEDEYRRLTEQVGGTYIHLGAPGVRLNPFDLEVYTRPDGRRTAPADALTRRKLFGHTVIRVLLGEQTPAQRAVLDTALTAAYAAAGITEDPSTWTRPAPTMSTLREQLTALGSTVAAEVADGLAPFTSGGAFAAVIDGLTTTVPDGGMIVFSLRELPDELKTIGTLLALDVTWRRMANPSTRRPRMVTVDEAWLLMRQPAGAEFLLRAAKSARKLWAGLTIATQDSSDVLSGDLGKAIAANASTQILLRQAPQAIDDVASAFKLSEGEQQYLTSAARGQGLLTAGTHKAVFATLASVAEDQVFTSDPGELAALASEGDDDGCIDLHDRATGPDTTGTVTGTGDSDSAGIDADLESPETTDTDEDGGDTESFLDLPEEA